MRALAMVMLVAWTRDASEPVRQVPAPAVAPIAAVASGELIAPVEKEPM
jgi:hypothetical protein